VEYYDERFSGGRMQELTILCMFDNKYKKFESLFRYGVEKYHPEYAVYTKCEENGIRNASLRHLLHPSEFGASPSKYYLITDIDILPDKSDVVAIRTTFMNRFNLGCYSNSPISAGFFPGVNFVTDEWYPLTEDARERHLRSLPNNPQKQYDELMLWKIIDESNIPMANSSGMLHHHGFHFGQMRGKNFSRHSCSDFNSFSSYIDDKELSNIISNINDIELNDMFSKVLRA